METYTKADLIDLCWRFAQQAASAHGVYAEDLPSFVFTEILSVTRELAREEMEQRESEAEWEAKADAAS